jgi:hypothetical protein
MTTSEGSRPARRREIARGAMWAQRRDYTSETKPFFLTSEFLAFLLYLMGLAIAAFSSDDIDARFFWWAATAATIGYMVSRGIAKSGSRSRAYDPREDIEVGRND